MEFLTMIKLFEQYNEYSQVKQWLDENEVNNYTINDDLTVDVDGDVYIWHDITNTTLSKLPIQFGKVMGNFYCNGCLLITLDGSPYYVGGNFHCNSNYLTTLEHCPEYIGGQFNCTSNKLTTLKYIPKTIIGNYSYSNNPLPIKVLKFDDIYIITKYQEEYGIWNSDGTFNNRRWEIFYQDYVKGLLD